MKIYLSLLRTPGVARIIAAQLTARFPGGMLSLAYLLHIERIHDSYGAAGLVLAATSVGQAIAGPLTSRWMGVWGMRPVLAITTAICALSILTVGFVPMTIPITMLVGFIGGLSYPPVQPAVRTIYPKMVNSRQLTPLFSLDASAQEIIWVAGPGHHDPRRDADLDHARGRAVRRVPRRRRPVVHLVARARARAHPAQQARARQGGDASRRCCS